MRVIFTDGFNSFSHFAQGFIANWIQLVLFAGVGYQLVQGGENMPVDLAEIAAGFVSGLVFKAMY